MAFYQRTGAPLYRAVLARFDGLNQVLQENMAGVRVVKAFVRSRLRERPLRREHNRDLQDAATAAQKLGGVPQPRAAARSSTSGSPGALWVGGDLVIDETIELGSVFVLLNYLVAVMIPLVLLSVLLPQIASRTRRWAGCSTCSSEVPDVQDEPEAPTLDRGDRRPGARPGRLRRRELRVHRPRRDSSIRDPVLHDIDLVAEPGQVVAILGRDRLGEVDARQPARPLLRRHRPAG